MYTIQSLYAFEILDSRGRPTIKAGCVLQNGIVGEASAPSGASTGSAEALELRDGDPMRYGGLGCRKAVAHVNHQINQAVQQRAFHSQSELDQFLIELDGSPNKANLGANAILSVSLAFARAAAQQNQQPLYAYFNQLLPHKRNASTLTLPRPTINLFSGGKHAGGQIAIQDVLIVPTAARSMDECMAVTYAVYQAAAKLTHQKYGARALTADEGGLAPPFQSVDEMLGDAVDAIVSAGYAPGQEVALAIDIASTHFYDNEIYHLGSEQLDGTAMIKQIAAWLDRYPIISVEDGLAEDDWRHWPQLCAAIGHRTLVLGDDLLCTNPMRIRRAIAERAATALLLKVNQIGTLTEAAEACTLAQDTGWHVTVSARSGETEDHWLADLAVGWSGTQIKVGSITQSERLAKYNRLLEIETHTHLPIVQWPK
ncbi:MAG: phosphopyruvate hydratase [Caldilineaceae bacterium]